MAKKKSARKKKSSKSRAKSNKNVSVKKRTELAWRKFLFFLMIFLVSFVFFSLSINELFKNFFGILSVVFGFLSFAFLVIFIIFLLLKSDKKSRKKK